MSKVVPNKSINDENDGTVPMMLKFNMHCDRCAQKVVKFVQSLHGVELVSRRENDQKKITVVGKVDPVKLREIVEVRYNRNVELIYPATKKHLDFVKDEINHKQFTETTVVLKVSLNCGGCRGCIKKIRKLVEETKGFVEMSIDKSNSLVTVKGAMDMKVLITTLQKKLNRQVEIVETKGNDGKKVKGDDANGEGKESGGQGATIVQGNGGGGKKENGGDGEGTKSGGRGARVVQGNGSNGKKAKSDDRVQERTKNGGQGARVVQGNGGDGNKGMGDDRGGEGKESGGRGPTVVQGKGDSGKKRKGGGVGEGPTLAGYNYRMENFTGQGQYTYPQYVNRPEYTFNYINITQMFNDENPNACVVM